MGSCKICLQSLFEFQVNYISQLSALWFNMLKNLSRLVMHGFSFEAAVLVCFALYCTVSTVGMYISIFKCHFNIPF